VINVNTPDPFEEERHRRLSVIIQMCVGCKHLRTIRNDHGKLKYAGCVSLKQIERYEEKNRLLFRTGTMVYKAANGEEVVPVACHPEYANGGCYEV
jgi:hypothetical protein